MRKQSQPGVVVTPSAKPESDGEMIDRHMAETRRGTPGINQTLKDVYGFSQTDLNGFAAYMNCSLVDDARELLERALARKCSIRMAS